MPMTRRPTILERLNTVLADPELGIVFRGGRVRLNRLGRLRDEYLEQLWFQQQIRPKLLEAQRQDQANAAAQAELERLDRQAMNRTRANHLRRARLAGVAINDFTIAEWVAIKEAWGYRCAYCGLKTDLTIEHVHPIARGGDHTASNIVPACQPCNSRKHDRFPPPFVVTPDLALLPAPVIRPDPALFVDVDDDADEDAEDVS